MKRHPHTTDSPHESHPTCKPSSSISSTMNALQPPPPVLHIAAPPVPNVPATDIDLMHADSYVEAMVVARRGESLMSTWTLFFVQWSTGGAVSLANVATSRVYQLEVLQQVQATSVNNLGMAAFLWYHLSSVDCCSISWRATLVPAGHEQHQCTIWSHW